MRLEILGPPRLMIGTEEIPTSNRQLVLLALLSMKDSGEISRAEAAHFLWPRAGTAAGRHSLSQAVYALKKAAKGKIGIRGSSTTLRLSWLESDVADFSDAVRREDWPAAAAVIRGPFLDGVDIPGEEYRLWVEGVRANFQDAAARVAEGLRLDGSVSDADRLQSRIAGQFFESERSTSEFLATAPIAPTQPDRSASSPSPFVGRQGEIAELEQFWRGSANGFRAVVVRGEPGIGKSALVNRFARLRAIRGSRVLTAKAYSPEQNVPFGVAAQWLRAIDSATIRTLDQGWIDIIEAAFPGVIQGSAGGLVSIGPRIRPSSEYGILEALRQLFQQLAGDATLVLILDDLHLSDSASLGFVHYFARRSSTAPVLFVATTRATPTGGYDWFPQGWDGLGEIVLGPLSRSDTHAIVSRVRGESTSASMSTEELSRLSGGNPLLILSFLASEGSTDHGDLPQSVLQHFRPRLEALSRDAAVMLAAISLHASPLTFELAGRISGLDSETDVFARTLAELETAGLAIASSETVRLRHGVIADVANAVLSAADGKALHARAARVLGQEGRAPPSVLAVRHDIAGERAKAFQTAVSAAAASEFLHATREREFFLKLALSNAPDSTSEARLRIELADLCRHNGRPGDGLDIAADHHFRSAPISLRRRARASRLAIELQTADHGKSIPQIWEDLLSLVPSIDPEFAAELFYLFAAAAHGLGRATDAVAATEHGLAIVAGRPLTTHGALIASRTAVGMGLYGNAQDGAQEIERLLPLVASNVEALGPCLSAYATLLVALGRLPEAEHKFLRAIELIERNYVYGALQSLHNNLGVCYTEQGRYAEAAAQFELAARAGTEFGRLGERSLVAENMAMLHIEQSDFEQALKLALPIGGNAEARSARALHYRYGVIGLCSLELGLLAQAFEAKREIELLFHQHEYWSNDVSCVETFLARMLVLEDRVDEARERLEKAIEVYRPRDLLCRSRLELELARIELKHDPVAALARSEKMLETLRGTGARPLIDRFDELADRARRRHPA